MTNYAHDVAEISAACRLCGEVHTAIVVEADFDRFYSGGVLVQEAFPEATPAVREIALAYRPRGYYLCPTCWDRMDASL